LRAYDPAIDDPIQKEQEAVPPLTSGTRSTPKGIAVGAAVLLGLAFGLGCWVWCDNEGLDKPQQRDVESYQAAMGNTGVPAPFESYGLEGNMPAVTTEQVVATVTETPQAVPQAVPSTTAPADVVYLFAYDNSKVPETPELTAIAEKAKAGKLTLDVKAYTDEHGRVEYNRRLSARRAKAIADYLQAHGVPASQIRIHAMGPTHAYANDAQDRRAEISIVE
ncbi:MAG: OmpA family protein, partial [Muribaculaceae bacterium]|nr:OmpA family protein [Muribaculaceae bacterium]